MILMILLALASGLVYGGQEPNTPLGSIPAAALGPLVQQLPEKKDLAALAMASKIMYTALEPTISQKFPLIHWRTNQFTLKKLGNHSAQVNSVAFSSDGHRLVSGSFDKTIKTWDLQSGKEGKPLLGHTNQVSSAIFSPIDSNIVVSSAYDTTVRLWNAQTGQVTQEFKCPFSKSLTSLAISADGKKLACGDVDANLYLTNLGVDQELRSIGELAGYDGVSILFIDDNKIVMGSTEDPCGGHKICCGEIEMGQANQTIINIKVYACEHSFAIFSPNHEKFGGVVYKLCDDGKLRWQIQILDVKSGTQIAICKCNAEIYAAAFSPDGSVLATASTVEASTSGVANRFVRIWSATTGQLIKEFPVARSANALSFSSDGTKLAVGLKDGTVLLIEKEETKFW